MISIKDLREKDFSRAVRGYSMEEVDDFLDELADQFEALIRENQRLQEAANAAPAPAAVVEEKPVEEPAPVEEKPAAEVNSINEPQYFKNLELTLRDTLVSAQRIADDTVAEARKKANQMVAAAEEKAAAIESAAKVEVESFRTESAELKKSVEDYRAKFLRLVQEQMHVLKADTELFGEAEKKED